MRSKTVFFNQQWGKGGSHLHTINQLLNVNTNYDKVHCDTVDGAADTAFVILPEHFPALHVYYTHFRFL